jgi:hypothetical protein
MLEDDQDGVGRRPESAADFALHRRLRLLQESDDKRRRYYTGGHQ